MAVLTSFIFAAFMAYIGAWISGDIDVNFTLLLISATAVSGLYWMAERFYFLPRHRRADHSHEASLAARNTRLANQGITRIDHVDFSARERLIMRPWWLRWTARLFPGILAVFLFHSFLFESFKVASSSMNPTLQMGDLILVNKFRYGLRLPVFNIKITSGAPPTRGDVMLFRHPSNPSLDDLERLIGLPGDEVSYLNKKLTINGQAITKEALPEYFDQVAMRFFKEFLEELDNEKHRLRNDDGRRSEVLEAEVIAFANQKNCRYSVEGIVCKVPEGHYFVMGDNRDHSLDSRYWGFVPDRNIVGPISFVLMNIRQSGPFWSVPELPHHSRSF